MRATYCNGGGVTARVRLGEILQLYSNGGRMFSFSQGSSARTGNAPTRTYMYMYYYNLITAYSYSIIVRVHIPHRIIIHGVYLYSQDNEPRSDLKTREESPLSRCIKC